MTDEQFTTLSPEGKRAARFEAWLAAGDVEFVSEQAKEGYRQRVQRFIDVIGLRKPDRVPVNLSTGFSRLTMRA